MTNFEKWKNSNSLETEVDVVSKIVEDVSDPRERCSACPASDFCERKYDNDQSFVPWIEERCTAVLKEWASSDAEESENGE